MNQILPRDYIITKFYQYSGNAKHKKGSDVYNGGCNICHEGNSWGKKKRLNYIPSKNIIHCFNCGRTWNPINWIMESSGMTFQEIMEESKDYDFTLSEFEHEEIKKPESFTLPVDSINLFDEQQINYYIDNNIVKEALLFIKKRKLDTAINRPKALYISLKDFIHKNRLVIPFYDYKNNIVWYQSRAIFKKDEIDRPKYMSKLNSEKSVFGLNKINPQLDYIFILEGPIDSMFISNGVAMGGIQMSELQEEQMNRYRFHEKIWILDNQFDENDDVKKQMNSLAEKGERIFIWPKKYKGIKDINELCVKVNKDSINPDFFIKNSYSGMEAILKLTTYS